MTQPPARPAPRLRRFARDETGSSALETVLVLPLLMWAILATFTFVDGYRMQSLNLRATYTISDLLTRQWDPVDAAFLTGLGKYHAFLTSDNHATSLRVTVVYYRAEQDDHRLVWSHSTDVAWPGLTDADMAALKPMMPALADADSAIIVETRMAYNPPFRVGLTSSQFVNRVIASPRFVPQLLFAAPTS